jgi:hypothetical protein
LQFYCYCESSQCAGSVGNPQRLLKRGVYSVHMIDQRNKINIKRGDSQLILTLLILIILFMR